MLRYLGTIVATAIVVLFLLVSAVPLMHWFRAEGRASQLDENRARWERLAIVDYQFAVEIDCPCDGLPAGPVRIVVRDGRPVSAAASPGGEPMPLPASPGFPLTIGDLFDDIASEIDAAASVLDVSYDGNYGYPREVYVDPDADLTGDETRIRVTAFDPRAVSDGEA
jgi:hypothetical protein